MSTLPSALRAALPPAHLARSQAHLFRVRGRRRRHRQAHRVDEAPPPARRRLTLVGLDHATATIELRERLAFTDAEIPPLLRRLTERLLEQAAILSTCNRVELYGIARSRQAELELASFLARDRRVAPEEVVSALYVHRGDQVAHRLAATAAGLHSLVLGETQIQGQVRRALELALTARAASEPRRLVGCVAVAIRAACSRVRP
jgi:glutamyl-tRNA reductase